MIHSTLTNGWCSELRVAQDLCSRGYEIYFGFGHNSCDMVAIRDGAILRVEVKTACMRDGKVSKSYPVDLSRHDVMALVTPDEIIYSGTAVASGNAA